MAGPPKHWVEILKWIFRNGHPKWIQPQCFFMVGMFFNNIR